MPSLMLRRSRGRADFKKAAGQNNHFLITTLVGLDAVARGTARKQPEFSTTWAPRDAERSAERSRMYVLSTAVVWISELVDAYRKRVGSMPGVFDASELDRITGTADDSRSVRLQRFAKELGLESSVDLALVRLGIHWRNGFAHGGSRTHLEGDVRGVLRKAAVPIAAQHNGLSVQKMITNEDEGAAPTFKEVATIIQASHDLIEELDTAVCRRVDPELFADAVVAEHLRGRSADGEGKRLHSLWQGREDRVRDRIEHVLRLAGFAEATDEDDTGSGLSDRWIIEVAKLSPADARTRFLDVPTVV